MGWGYGGFGITPWGAGGVSTLQLVSALAVRENTVRLTFNTGVEFTGILNAGDGSNIERYSVIAVAGTVGFDGEAVRQVSPVTVEVVSIPESFGSVLDLTVDRPFTAYPSRYMVSVQGVNGIGGVLLDPAFASLTFDGARRVRPKPRIDHIVGSRDIANPQTRSALLDPLPNTTDSLILGTYPVDETGDIAIDEGIDGYRKRVFRRCMTRKGKFAWLPGYGVGLPGQVKKLGRRGVRDAIAADAETQIGEEPETVKVEVRFETDAQRPDLFWLRVRAQTVFSTTPVEMGVPFSPTG
jgi:hypothetical protein